MDGLGLSEILREAYDITYKYSTGPNVPLISRWKGRGIDGEPEVFDSLDKLKGHIASRFCGNWEFIDEQTNGNGTVYTFLSIPHPDSPVGLNPRIYPKHYCHVRVRARLSSKLD